MLSTVCWTVMAVIAFFPDIFNLIQLIDMTLNQDGIFLSCFEPWKSCVCKVLKSQQVTFYRQQTLVTAGHFLVWNTNVIILAFLIHFVYLFFGTASSYVTAVSWEFNLLQLLRVILWVKFCLKFEFLTKRNPKKG